MVVYLLLQPHGKQGPSQNNLSLRFIEVSKQGINRSNVAQKKILECNMNHIQAMASTAGSDNMPTEVKIAQKKAPEENIAPYKQRQIENIFKCYGNCFFNPHEYTQA